MHGLRPVCLLTHLQLPLLLVARGVVVGLGARARPLRLGFLCGNHVDHRLIAMRASNMQVNISRAWFKYLILLPLLLKGTPGFRSGGGQLGFELLQLLCVLYLAVSGRRAAFNRSRKTKQSLKPCTTDILPTEGVRACRMICTRTCLPRSDAPAAAPVPHTDTQRHK